MIYSLLNSALQWNLRPYTKDLFKGKDYAIGEQNKLLQSFLKKAQNTVIGQQYNFGAINDHRSFVAKVPLHEYEEFRPLIDRMRQGEEDLLWPGRIRWFSKSGGTTNGASKFIPLPHESLVGTHMKGGKTELALYFKHRPSSTLFKGLGLRLSGSSQWEPHGKSGSGDLSAIIIQHMPRWAEYRSAPSYETALIGEWEDKMEALLDEVIDQNITSFWGVSSWFLVFFNKVIERTGAKNLLEVWPNLELFAHGGVSFAPYEEQFKALMPSDRVTFMENYNASEGFFAIQDNPDQQGMLLLTNCGSYYEFIPMSSFKGTKSETIGLSEVETGIDYALVITTSGGLWRYILGDTVRFVTTDPYRIIVSGRTSQYINAFGEELIVTNADEALSEVCKKHNATIRNYHAAPIFLEQGTTGAHQWLIEFERHPKDLSTFSSDLDALLQSKNSDYQAKRQGNLVLRPLEVISAADGLYFTWLERKKKLGGQNKIPRLSNDRKLMDEFIQLHSILGGD